ncbi:MAG: DegT/DnrJ/EryC1/StrS family aminotransferase [Candidatus Omnitrophica bacterium]|nr:DegT/DnrJ/EryC1/StrS family aminotransferase [Candidatus Omnitrophota bacterium]
MKVSILDLKKQYQFIKSEVDKSVKNVIDNQNFILGEDVSAFEAETAAYCGTKYGVGLASGTDALILALKALGIGTGDEVITSPFTFFATAEAISIVGAKPIFVDIDPQTYNINPALIEKAITSKTKAVIPVHLYGQCADMDPILSIARKHKLKVIEDAAQAIGATYKGRKAGSMGDIGCLSFFPSKNLGAFGDAGMVVTNDKKVADRIRMLRVHGSAQRYIHSEIGMNSRLDNLQAAVLRVKLRYLDRWLEARRKNAAYYNEKLKDLPVVCPYVPEYNVHTYHLYVIRLKNRMEELSRYLNSSGIEARTYYPVPLHLQECYRNLGYRKGDLKESEKASEQTLSFAVYPELDKAEMNYIVEKIREFLRDNR